MKAAENGDALTAKFPIVAAPTVCVKLRADSGEAELNIATNFLYMLTGESFPEDAHVLDVALILQADHD